MRELNKELRPKSFDEVVGQNSTKILLQRAIQQERLPRLVLFSGPSGTGKSTLAEITARQIAEESQVKKVNMGALQGKSDVLEVLKEVFVLQAGQGNNVFILEEVHSLSKDQQIPFLEEIERQQERVFVFMCTTEPNRLIPELRGRATQFRLERPSVEECMNLIETACKALEMKVPTKQSMRYMVRRIGTVPRELIKVIDILSVAGDLTEQTISKYLGVVNVEVFVKIFKAAKEEDLFNFHQLITSEEYETTDIVRGLKDFFKDLMEYIYGDNKQIFTLSEKRSIQETMEDVRQEDLLTAIEYVGKMQGQTEIDSFYELLSFRRTLQGTTKQVEVKESKREAVKSEIKSEEQTRQNKIHKVEHKEEELTLDMIQSITGSVEVYTDK